jgi:hypothetical protein
VTSEAKYLQQLLAACHRVLPQVEEREDELAAAIRETCRTVEARPRLLGVNPEQSVG